LANEDRTALEAGKGFIRMCKPVIDSISVLEWKTSMGFWTVLLSVCATSPIRRSGEHR
jgi:hypothetical protein